MLKDNERLKQLIVKIERGNNNEETLESIKKELELELEKDKAKVLDEILFIRISTEMKKIGLPKNIKGYRFLIEAIIICYKESLMPSMTKSLYPQIGKKYKKDGRQVERAIRYAIESVWEKGDKDIINDLFQYNVEKRPTNSEFIAVFVEKLRMEDFQRNL